MVIIPEEKVQWVVREVDRILSTGDRKYRLKVESPGCRNRIYFCTITTEFSGIAYLTLVRETAEEANCVGISLRFFPANEPKMPRKPLMWIATQKGDDITPTPCFCKIDQTNVSDLSLIDGLVDIIGRERMEEIIRTFNAAIPENIKYDGDVNEDSSFKYLQINIDLALRKWAGKRPDGSFLMTVYSIVDRTISDDVIIWGLGFPRKYKIILTRSNSGVTFYKYDDDGWSKGLAIKMLEEDIKHHFGYVLVDDINNAIEAANHDKIRILGNENTHLQKTTQELNEELAKLKEDIAAKDSLIDTLKKQLEMTAMPVYTKMKHRIVEKRRIVEKTINVSNIDTNTPGLVSSDDWGKLIRAFHDAKFAVDTEEIKQILKELKEEKEQTESNPDKDPESVISPQLNLGDKAPKKWVDLYTLLYDHFASWCHRHDATLQQKTFGYSIKEYISGITFCILKRNSSCEKDKLKFSVFYDELTEQVTMRFYAENVDIVIDGHRVHESGWCEPIISVFICNVPKDGVKMFDITNGDQDNKMERDWRPLDVLKVYFGDKFWDNILEIFGKFIPKQTKPFWEKDPKYRHFNELRTEIHRYLKQWFSVDESVTQIILSENVVGWEIQTPDGQKYLAELTHKTDNGTTDDILIFLKKNPESGYRTSIVGIYELDYEFGPLFYNGIKTIYDNIREKISDGVSSIKDKTAEDKDDVITLSEGAKKVLSAMGIKLIYGRESGVLSKEEYEKIISDLNAEFVKTKEEKEMNEDVKKAIAAAGKIVEEASATPKFPHFSTSKDGVKLATIPFETYRIMTNTQYGMNCVMMKDPSSMIRDSYWNPKTFTATIIWVDGTRTMAKPMEGTTADPEIGFALCIAKKFMGGTQNQWRKWLSKVVKTGEAVVSKKKDKRLSKLTKQARARLAAEGITEPSQDQVMSMIDKIDAENKAAAKTAKPEPTTASKKSTAKKKSSGTTVKK